MPPILDYNFLPDSGSMTARCCQVEKIISLPVRIAAESEPPRCYPVIEIAKLSGLDLEAYLRNIVALTADHPINRIDELLPWTWKAVADKLAA